jgi:hypothetical protein
MINKRFCLKRSIEMVIGKVLEPYSITNERSSISGNNNISKVPTLVECFKCPTCGHSEPIDRN